MVRSKTCPLEAAQSLTTRPLTVRQESRDAATKIFSSNIYSFRSYTFKTTHVFHL